MKRTYPTYSTPATRLAKYKETLSKYSPYYAARITWQLVAREATIARLRSDSYQSFKTHLNQGTSYYECYHVDRLPPGVALVAQDQGYYTDEYCDETIDYGVALLRTKTENIYIPVTYYSESDSVTLHLDDAERYPRVASKQSEHDCHEERVRDCLYQAKQSARIEAEEAREHHYADETTLRKEEIQDEFEENRSTIRRTLQTLRLVRKHATTHTLPGIEPHPIEQTISISASASNKDSPLAVLCESIRRDVQRLLDTRASLIEQYSELC